MRKAIIAGNWKMNLKPQEGVALVEALLPLVKDANCDVVICPPFVDLPAVGAALAGSNVRLGAQNMHFESKGAYTGEVSADMLKELGVQYVIIGHSERREYFCESNETVNRKIKAALANELLPIMCCGESLSQREKGETNAFVGTQIKESLAGLTKVDMQSVVIAYEPIWAIGTGVTATNEEADATIAEIRRCIEQIFGAETAQSTRIQYGGSMNANNASALMAMPNIDGGLIGGASLKADDFSKVVHFDK